MADKYLSLCADALPHSSVCVSYIHVRVCMCACVCESPAQSPDAGFNFCSVTQRAGRRGESGCDCQKLALVPQLVCVRVCV